MSHGCHCRNRLGMVSKWSVRAKILVVDDEPEAVELLEFNLKQAGFDVIAAADGAQAIRKARSALPNLIVLDLMRRKWTASSAWSWARRIISPNLSARANWCYA